MYRALSVAVVVPAYNESKLLLATLETLPEFVDHVVVVDDASQDSTSAVARSWCDSRLTLITFGENQGVGAAIVAGYQASLGLGVDAVAVMGGDNQMDPADLAGLLDALIDEEADYIKGDRLSYPGVREAMPPVRYLGTLALGYLTRIPCGYWQLQDAQCGYTVARAALLNKMALDALYPRYGFPNDMLARVGDVDGRIGQRTVRPVYGQEVSGLRVPKVILPISKILLRGVARRAWRKLREASPLMSLLLALFAGALVGFAAAPTLAQVGPGPFDALSNDEEPQQDPRLVRFEAALRLVEEHYVDPVDVALLIHQGAHGMVQALDKHSRFMPPNKYKTWRNRIHGKNTSVGIEVLFADGLVRVAAVSEGSPAEAVGILVGDQLLSVDGEDVSSLGLKEIHTRLKGEAGTQVVLEVVLGDAKGSKRFELIREKVKAVPVLSRKVGGVGLIKVRAFHEGATADARAALESWQAEGPLEGLIVDLRGNLGGLLSESVSLADLFLAKDLEVVSLEKQGEVEKRHLCVQEALSEAPMVVLVNAKSASASEIFAAAMKDHQRGEVIGWATYGKGTVQSTYPLRDGSGLKLTTSRYLTPAGLLIDGEGVIPSLETVPDQGLWGELDETTQVALELLRGSVPLEGAE